jgi:hypothetical protein
MSIDTEFWKKHQEQSKKIRTAAGIALLCAGLSALLAIGAILTGNVKVVDRATQIAELEAEIAELKAQVETRAQERRRVEPVVAPGETLVGDVSVPESVTQEAQKVNTPAPTRRDPLADHDWSYVNKHGEKVVPPQMPAGHPVVEPTRSPMERGEWTLTHADGSRAASVEVTFTDPTGALLPETVTSNALGEVQVPEAFLKVNFEWESEPRNGREWKQLKEGMPEPRIQVKKLKPCKRCTELKCKECDHREFTLVKTYKTLVSGERKISLGRRCLCCKRRHGRKPEVRAYFRDYHAKLREAEDGAHERLKDDRRRWRQKNRERINARHRERMATDPEYAARCKETRRKANERRVKRMREDPEFREGENAIRRMKDKEKRDE